jgi:hypothetical protein
MSLVLSSVSPGTLPPEQPEPEQKPRKRARDTDGQFVGDDPATPDVDEAWQEN